MKRTESVVVSLNNSWHLILIVLHRESALCYRIIGEIVKRIPILAQKVKYALQSLLTQGTGSASIGKHTQCHCTAFYWVCSQEELILVVIKQNKNLKHANFKKRRRKKYEKPIKKVKNIFEQFPRIDTVLWRTWGSSKESDTGTPRAMRFLRVPRDINDLLRSPTPSGSRIQMLSIEFRSEKQSTFFLIFLRFLRMIFVWSSFGSEKLRSSSHCATENVPFRIQN